MKNGLGIGDQAQHRWPDQQTGGEIAQDRSKPDLPEHRHGDNRRPHQDDRRSDHLPKARFSHHARGMSDCVAGWG
jgi:hypothetical protein